MKYDWCRADETDGLNREDAFSKMRVELDRTGRPVTYAISEYGVGEPRRWARPIAHQWRTTQDLLPTWESIAGVLDAQAELAPFAAPGGWNDPDMLQFGNGDLSPAQNHSHFAMWCMLAAPLFIGTDIRALSDANVALLSDSRLIAIDQDPLGQQAARVHQARAGEVWARRLASGAHAVAFFNPLSASTSVTVEARTLPFDGADWRATELGTDVTAPIDSNWTVDLPPYATRVFRVARS